MARRQPKTFEALVKYRGLTWRGLSKAAGVSVVSLWHWRTGKFEPHRLALASVAAVLGVSPEVLAASIMASGNGHGRGS